MPQLNLYQVKGSELKKGATILADAFGKDPLFLKIVPYNKVINVTEAFLRYCSVFGEVYAVSKNFEGVMALSRDTFSQMTVWRLVSSGAVFPLLKLGVADLIKLATIFEPVDLERKKYSLHKRYIYLQMVGVANEYQGMGFGSQLLDQLVQMSRAEERSIYLETETEKNVEFYQKFGFRIVKTITLPLIDYPLWIMERPLDKHSSN